MQRKKGLQSLDKSMLIADGLAKRGQITDCPMGAFKVNITKCNGENECAKVCLVNAISTGQDGKCFVVDDELCFGCTACMAQCQENGITVSPM